MVRFQIGCYGVCNDGSFRTVLFLDRLLQSKVFSYFMMLLLGLNPCHMCDPTTCPSRMSLHLPPSHHKYHTLKVYASVAMKDKLGPGEVGLILVYVMQLMGMLQWIVRCSFFDRDLHSRMPLDPTSVRLKRAGV
jgi:hypothetical protein